MIRSNKTLIIAHVLIIVVITSLTYLPNLSQATIYRDDWYYTLDRTMGGPYAFGDMFYIDRPARGLLFETFYQLFGVEPKPYHIVHFIFRILTSLAAWVLFLTIWPKQWKAALMFTLLFAIYPGYTRWMEGFENQPNIISLFCEVASILLTLLAIKSKKFIPKVVYWVFSIISGWIYLSLIDYAIGMEIFRWLSVFTILNMPKLKESIFKKLKYTVRYLWPSFFIPGVFLFWRLFKFENFRPETDLSLQLAKVLSSPLLGSFNWIMNLIKSLIFTTFQAWVTYSFNEFFQLDTIQMVYGLVFAIGCGIFALIGIRMVRSPNKKKNEFLDDEKSNWFRQSSLIGLLGLIAGILPVVITNRSISAGPFSHYSVPVSLAVAFLVVGMLFFIQDHLVRTSLFLMLIFLAVITQFAASSLVITEVKTIANFWHQVAWRAPGIRSGTGLLINYPGIKYGEDVDAVSGPANFIYFNLPVGNLPVYYPLQGMKFYPWTVNDYLSGAEIILSYRTHYGKIDVSPEKMLVMSQPTRESCVHIINQDNPWFSYDDPPTIIIVSKSSNLDNILLNLPTPILKESIFGPEPAHDWCFYYQKAELANQKGELQNIVSIGNEIEELNLRAYDSIEWMPFIQAYAYMGYYEKADSLINIMKQTPFYQNQACQAYKSKPISSDEKIQTGNEYLAKAFCE